MLRRCALLFVGTLVASPAFASFELALVLQNFTPPGQPGGLRVTRWDPVAQVPLGSFAVPGLNSTSKLFLNRSTPGVVTGVTAGSGFIRLSNFNYSTGEYLGQTSISIPITSLNSVSSVGNNELLITGLNSGTAFARVYNTSGGILRTFVLPSLTVEAHDAILGDDGITHILTRQPGTVSGNRWTITSYAIGSGLSSNNVTVQDNTTSVPTDFVRAGATLAVNTGSLATRRVVPVSGLTFGGVFSPLGVTYPVDRFVVGHNDLIHGFAFDSGQTRMVLSSTIIDNASGVNASYFPGTTYGTVYDAVAVVAPEPGTLLAIGVGVAALLRRRRTK